VGAVLSNGIHETDLLRWFAGAEPASVFAEHSTTIAGNRVPDFITITVKFTNGALGSAEVSNCWPPGYPSYHQLELYGTAGMIRSRDSDQQGLIRFRPEGADFPGSYQRLLHVQDAYTTELALFAQALQQGQPVPLPASEARAALRLGLAAVDSATLGMPITFGGEPGEGGAAE
jgi:predicted dehydrogenase